MKNVLVLAPHADDGELGCGGTISKMIEEGNNVFYIAFSLCEESIPTEFPKNIMEKELKLATKELGIKEDNLIIKNYPVRCFPSHRQDILEDLIKLKSKINPDIVFMPSSFDVHQDHAVINQESKRAFKHSCMLGYEFMWNNFSFDTTAFVIIEERHIQAKINALKKYESQKQRFYTSDESLRGLAQYRGLQMGERFAESFEVIRWILR
jgi:LmbE family N-acetylglucosaminyl deacetylase